MLEKGGSEKMMAMLERQKKRNCKINILYLVVR
jgi:hypothetical protein